MNGVTVLVPCTERDGLEEIRWGAEDRHDADDPNPDSPQYSSWWRVGLRDVDAFNEIWQLKASNCRLSTAHLHPLQAYCTIVLRMWTPEFINNTYMDIWKISVRLTLEEIVNSPYVVHTVSSNTTIAGNEYMDLLQDNNYKRLLEKTRNIYDQFFKNPYGVMMRVALK